jgi:hypothetical protein
MRDYKKIILFFNQAVKEYPGLDYSFDENSHTILTYGDRTLNFDLATQEQKDFFFKKIETKK